MVTNMDAGSIQKMGVHLSAEDVAKVVYVAVYRLTAGSYRRTGQSG